MVPPADYDQFSISIPKESVVQGGVRIADVLADVPEEVEVRMRESEAAGTVGERHISAGHRTA